MTAAERAERTARADALCQRAFETVGCPGTGVALVAVGGYGRSELAPHSDLDVVLVHDDAVEPGEWSARLWYPLWDSGTRIDHAVRSTSQVLEQAAADLRVALGLLDTRHLAGDPNLTLRLRTAVLAQWRRDARLRLDELRELVGARNRRQGELAHASVPDLKESEGGLRDATVLRGLVASWLVDVPHTDLERSRQTLLDVRDALHGVTGRPGDRIAPEVWPELAAALDLPDALAAQQQVRLLGRRITHLSHLTWRRAEAVLRRPATGVRRPRLETVARGVALSHEEVVLDRDAEPGRDPLLLLRAAAEAAERGAVLSPATASRLARDGAALPDPWPAEARDLFVRLLAAGPGLLPVWETLEETGALGAVLPEWERVRLLPHASVVHRFTVDRHLVETCVEAAALIRQVSRPDVLMVAALLHDIGKGELGEHCVVGAPIARRIATRMGFGAREIELIGTLVRWHLLLPEVATSRDLEDPATLAEVVARIEDREALTLLATLTEADARATSEQAWSRWRAGLVADLVRRVVGELGGPPHPHPLSAEAMEIPAASLADPDRVALQVIEQEDGSEVVVVSGDRVGLLADAAAMLAAQRVGVRAARAWTQEGPHGSFGVSTWQVAERGLDPAVLRQRLEAVVRGADDVAGLLGRLGRPVRGGPDPQVVVHHGASVEATVLEVRSEDRPGLVHLVCRVLAGLRLSVRSAHVSTLGPQAVDVFYVQEVGAGALTDDRAASAATAVRRALEARTD